MQSCNWPVLGRGIEAHHEIAWFPRDSRYPLDTICLAWMGSAHFDPMHGSARPTRRQASMGLGMESLSGRFSQPGIANR
eukprot:scaffold1639_cov331-Pavlova_lutheri.AAC.15